MRDSTAGRTAHNPKRAGIRRRYAGALCLVSVLILQGCAKIGAPEPPLVKVPRPSTDLAAQEHSDGITLTVSMPALNTDGSPVSSLKQIEVYRIIEAGRGPWLPLSQEEFLWRAERIIDLSDDFSGYIHGSQLVFSDALPAAGRGGAYQKSFRYAVRFINARNQTAGLGNQATIAPVPLPLPPSDLSSDAGQDFVRIRWSPPAENDDGSRPARVAGYRIYRSEDPKSPSPVPLNDTLLLKPEFTDRDFQFDKTYYYVVSVVASTANPYAESRASTPLAVSTVDTYPPGAPGDLHAVLDRGVVILLWTAPEAPDIAGYRIYRAEGADGVFQLLAKSQVTLLSYRDQTAQTGKQYRYSVRTVDTHGNEGPPAETSIEIP